MNGMQWEEKGIRELVTTRHMFVFFFKDIFFFVMVSSFCLSKEVRSSHSQFTYSITVRYPLFEVNISVK